MKTTIEYKGHTCTMTSTTTDVYRQAFGHQYHAYACVWEIEGKYGKNACCRPFLTSAAECRAYINGQIELHRPLTAEEQAWQDQRDAKRQEAYEKYCRLIDSLPSDSSTWTEAQYWQHKRAEEALNAV